MSTVRQTQYYGYNVTKTLTFQTLTFGKQLHETSLSPNESTTRTVNGFVCFVHSVRLLRHFKCHICPEVIILRRVHKRAFKHSWRNTGFT